MDFDDVVEGVVRAVEVVGILVLVGGAIAAFAGSAATLLRRRPAARSATVPRRLRSRACSDDRSGPRSSTHHDPYGDLRRNLARVILLGLEVLILADIIRTIVVDQTLQNVMVLGVVVLIRILLSWSLQVEIEGAWPWQRARLDRDASVPGPEPGDLNADG